MSAAGLYYGTNDKDIKNTRFIKNLYEIRYAKYSYTIVCYHQYVALNQDTLPADFIEKKILMSKMDPKLLDIHEHTQ